MTSHLNLAPGALDRLRAAAKRIPGLGADPGAFAELAVDLDTLAAYQAAADAVLDGYDETDEDGRPVDAHAEAA